jgi:hypothetical protein
LQAEVTIRSRERLRGIPRSFLGLSTEYWTLPVDERHIALYRRVLSLLHVPGDGPFVLRIGGDSSDHTFYDPRILKLPRRAFDLTHVFASRTARIVRELRLRVVLDLNLVTGTPSFAGAWAREAEGVLPQRSIIGFEIGNEPDLYSRTFWLLATEGDRFGARVLPRDINAKRVCPGLQLVRARVRAGRSACAVACACAGKPGCRREMDLHAPRSPAPRAGRHQRAAVSVLYSACAFPGSPEYPTIDRVLSENATAGVARTLKPAVRLAHKARLPFRLTELNSGLLARPLIYGLILFARTLGPNSRLVPLRFHAGRSLHLKAWAVKVSKAPFTCC